MIYLAYANNGDEYEGEDVLAGAFDNADLATQAARDKLIELSKTWMGVWREAFYKVEWWEPNTQVPIRINKFGVITIEGIRFR